MILTISSASAASYSVAFPPKAARLNAFDVRFEWSRNPMYLSMLGNISSVGLMANTWWCVAAMLPFAAYLNFCIVPAEEAYLRAKFGAGYESYRERTPRWFLW
eukprot:Skav201267  [mRNA]  locus=scaffold1810:30593:32199:+ [translate_table: standard]